MLLVKSMTLKIDFELEENLDIPPHGSECSAGLNKIDDVTDNPVT